jgi:hypothetical protein
MFDTVVLYSKKSLDRDKTKPHTKLQCLCIDRSKIQNHHIWGLESYPLNARVDHMMGTSARCSRAHATKYRKSHAADFSKVCITMLIGRVRLIFQKCPSKHEILGIHQSTTHHDY